MENRVIYTEKKAYNKYDESRYMVYLNEEILPDYMPEDLPEDSELRLQPVTGYAYTGTEPDGGTLIEAKFANYDDFVAGLIRLKYTADAESAINSNMILAISDSKNSRAKEFKTEWQAFQTYRDECKAQARLLLS